MEELNNLLLSLLLNFKLTRAFKLVIFMIDINFCITIFNKTHFICFCTMHSHLNRLLEYTLHNNG